MNYDMHVWFIIFVLAVVVSVAMQAIVLLAVLFGIARLYAKVKQIEAKLLYHAAVITDLTTKARDAVDVLMRIGHNVADISDQARSVADLAGDVSRKQLGYADQVATDVLTGVEQLSGSIEKGISEPAREFRAISVGLRTALTLLFHRSSGDSGFREAQRGSRFDHRKAG
ncbi:MAG TPA: hypothetical protein VFZ27_18760 [Terriglobia bacterium]|nr:hypothetical protein [Terriglobia bacterium]